MNSFYSSLVINSKKFRNVHQILKPRYNKEYFKRVTANLAQLETLIEQRCKAPDPSLSSDKLKDLEENAAKLVRLKERLEKIDVEDSRYRETLDRVEDIEDRLMPTVVAIPNRTSKLVPAQDTTVDEIKSDFQAKENLVKVLSHRKLSYINNCYSKSVVGPNSHYYFGIGAKLQHALSSYFTEQLEREDFIATSGLCLTKSALVEAANTKDGRDYFHDPSRVVDGSPRYTTQHLCEASRESLVGLLTSLGPIVSNEPLRLMSSGASYRAGSDWFDGDDKRITQIETVHAVVLNSSIEQYSMREYHFVRDIIWSAYKQLELPARLVHCSTDSMLMNEFDSHRIDVWLPSRQEWIQASRVSHYLDYITVRAGMKRGHIIDSTVYDGQAVAAAIIENRQTAFGKFIVPSALADRLIHMSQEERESYLRNGPAKADKSPKAQVLTNHEQRRHLVKKNYLFGHSKKAEESYRKKHGFKNIGMVVSSLSMFLMMLDWDSIWCDTLPDEWREFIYDNIRRPAFALWYWLICEEQYRPVDPPYAEIDKSKYQKTRAQRLHESLSWEHNRTND